MALDAKIFPKTVTALQSLQETIALLEENAAASKQKNKELTANLAGLKKEIAQQTACIDAVIQNLNGALK